MKLFERIQGLPEKKRKIILWTALAVMAVILLYFLLTNFQEKLKNLNTPEFPEPEIPELNLPSIINEEK